MTPDRIESMQSGKMQLDRALTQAGKSPYEFDVDGNPIGWISESVSVTDDKGKVVFTQPNVRRPDFWSALAVKVVASKYFWGDQSKGEREDSIEKIIGRVARYFEKQAVIQRYFDDKQAAVLKDEITALCLNQLGSFNSPVWFNAGIQEYNPQAGGVAPKCKESSHNIED